MAKRKTKKASLVADACCEIMEPAPNAELPIGSWVDVTVKVNLNPKYVREVWAGICKYADVPADPLEIPYWAGALWQSTGDNTIWEGLVDNGGTTDGQDCRVLAWVVAVQCAADPVPVKAVYPVFFRQWLDSQHRHVAK